jgi:hypothetical protein
VEANVARKWVCAAVGMLWSCAILAHPSPDLARAIAQLLARPVTTPLHSVTECSSLVQAAGAAGVLLAWANTEQQHPHSTAKQPPRAGAAAAAVAAEGYMSDLHSIMSSVIARLSACPRGVGGMHPLSPGLGSQLMRSLLIAAAVKGHPATMVGLRKAFPEVATRSKELVEWCDVHWVTGNGNKRSGTVSATQHAISQVRRDVEALPHPLIKWLQARSGAARCITVQCLGPNKQSSKC